MAQIGTLLSIGGGESGAVKGAASAAENVVGSDVLPQAGALLDTTSPVFSQYLAELESLTSSDPTTRMEAIAPTIAQQTALEQGQEQQIANMPRGGQSAYLDSLVQQGDVTAIGNALSQEFNSALSAEGQAGEFGISTALNSELGSASTFLGAGNVYQGAAAQSAQGTEATEQMIAQLAEAAAG